MTEDVIQAETPAPAVIAESAPAAVETSVVPESTIPKGRFDEVYGKWKSTERDLEYWRELAVRQNKPEPVVEKAPELPTPEQHGFDDAKYQAALTDYNRHIARSEALSVIKAEREQERQQAKVQTFRQREAEFAAKNPAYQEKVYNNAVPISEAMVELIAESEDGPAVAMYLADNIELASQIYGLSPVQTAREMGRIEARLAQAKVAPVPKPVLTNAPPPPPTIEAVEPAVVRDLGDPKISDAEFAKIRKRQIAQRR